MLSGEVSNEHNEHSRTALLLIHPQRLPTQQQQSVQCISLQHSSHYGSNNSFCAFGTRRSWQSTVGHPHAHWCLLWASHHSQVSAIALINHQTTYFESKVRQRKREGKYELFHELCKPRKQVTILSNHAYNPPQDAKKLFRAQILNECQACTVRQVYSLCRSLRRVSLCCLHFGSMHKKSLRCIYSIHTKKQLHVLKRKKGERWQHRKFSSLQSVFPPGNYL